MKKVSEFLLSDKMYLYLTAGAGAYFVYRGEYPLAYLDLVLVLLLINKINKDEPKDRSNG
jgi:hypothetical protein